MGAIHRNTGDTREHTYRREEPTPGNRPAHEATHAREHTRCTKRSSRADRTQELSKGSRRVQPGLLILFYIYIFFFLVFPSHLSTAAFICLYIQFKISRSVRTRLASQTWPLLLLAFKRPRVHCVRGGTLWHREETKILGSIGPFREKQ